MKPAAQNSVPPTGGTPRTPFGQPGNLCGWKLVPAKRRSLVPPRRIDRRSRVETTRGYPQGASQTQPVGRSHLGKTMNRNSALSPDALINELLTGSLHFTRRDAAEKLRTLSDSNPQIVSALIAAREADDHLEVRQAAEEALRAASHERVLWLNRDQVTTLIAAQKERQFHAFERSKVELTRKQKILPILLSAIYLVVFIGIYRYLEQRRWDNASLWVAIIGWMIAMGYTVIDVLRRSGYKGASTLLRFAAVGFSLFALLWLLPREKIPQSAYPLLGFLILLIEAWDSSKL